jgi:hypothetical protein
MCGVECACQCLACAFPTKGAAAVPTPTVCLLRCPKLGAAFGCGWIESTGYLMQQRQVRLGVSDGLSVVLVLLPTCRGKLGLSAGVQLQYGRRG